MAIKLSFLDHLYQELEAAKARVESHDLPQAFPDDGYSDKVHRATQGWANGELQRIRATLERYVKDHGGDS